MSPNCPSPKKIQGCFGCGSTDHLVRNCPKKNAEKESGNKGPRGRTLATRGPAQRGRPTARTFNMTAQDTVATQEVAAGNDFV